MTTTITLLSIALIAAFATFAYYRRRVARADSAIERLETEIAEMDSKATSHKTESKCKVVCLGDDAMELVAAAAKNNKGSLSDGWTKK